MNRHVSARNAEIQICMQSSRSARISNQENPLPTSHFPRPPPCGAGALQRSGSTTRREGWRKAGQPGPESGERPRQKRHKVGEEVPQLIRVQKVRKDPRLARRPFLSGPCV